MTGTIAIALFGGALILACLVTLVERDHGWAKFYNWLADIFGWNPKDIPMGENSDKHQEKCLVSFLFICEGVASFIYGILIWLKVI